MGCQASCVIDNNLTFSICTHDPDTGVLTDASSVSYRVYEDETATAILNGTMDKLDDANTTGFYTELLAITTANGFEVGKSYTIYIEATVDGDTGGISYGFTVEPAFSTHSAADVKTTIEAGGSHLTLIKAVTDALTSAAATKLALSAGTIIPATVNDAGGSTTAFITTLTSAVNDFYNGRIIIFTDGDLAYQATDITGYAGATKTVTVTALTAAPANGVAFVVV